MTTKKKQVIRLERDGVDRIIPKDFSDILVHRFLPVISMTYIAAILGIAANKGNLIHYLFEVKTAYVMSMFIVLWVSGPGIMWIFIHGSPMFRHTADLWYKILAGIMTLTIMLSFMLFPEMQIYGLRIYFAISVPVFIIMYYFFVKGGLPAMVSYPLNTLGVAALLFGAYLAS
tara:strand:- start:1766 stop:2284 length:519 start_codon:yes stop_codon:yes gene_type:complete